jgi:hypothetical protein
VNKIRILTIYLQFMFLGATGCTFRKDDSGQANLSAAEEKADLVIRVARELHNERADFRAADSVDYNDRVQFLSHRILRAIELIQQRPEKMNPLDITPDVVHDALFFAYGRDVALEVANKSPRFKFQIPAHYQKSRDNDNLDAKRGFLIYSIDRLSLVPLMTQLTTKLIRKPKEPENVKKMLGAVALPEGPTKILVQKAIERDYPQMKGMFIPAEYHRLQLQSIYIENKEDARRLISLSLVEKFPRLERIVTSLETLQFLAPSLANSYGLKQGSFPSSLAIVLTDDPGENLFRDLDSIFTKERNLQRIFKGIGFLSSKPLDKGLILLQEFLGKYAMDRMELDIDSFTQATLCHLTKSKIRFYSQRMIDLYFHELTTINPILIYETPKVSTDIKRASDRYKQLITNLSLRGLNISMDSRIQGILSTVIGITEEQLLVTFPKITSN